MPGVGTGSSPRATDLNKDGILDIVIGAGSGENQYSDTAVIALNGANGALLWKVSARNQIVGSAIFKDITGDGVDDVFIGGRSAEMMAINGADGNVLWKFLPDGNQKEPAEEGWFIFASAQFIPDQDQDGTEDLLIANGGNYLVKAHESEGRMAGNLVVVSSKTGKLLAKAAMPDGKETYMSAVQTDFESDGLLEIIFGTGGETIGGNLYRTTLQDLMGGDISKAIVLASGSDKGFIAPPVLADITRDGIPDIIANAVDGRMIAINGATNKLQWIVHLPGTEAYATPATGFFTTDEVPDFFSNYGIGTWPSITQSVQFLVDGRTGNILQQDTIGGFQYASPVTADFDEDGFDDVLLSINNRFMGRDYETWLSNKLMVFNFQTRSHYMLGDSMQGNNIAATPWVGDLNGDGKMEVLCSAMDFRNFNNDIDSPKALRMKLIATPFRIRKKITWGSYMGTSHDGLLPKSKKPG
jgi:outer membrane protein assembly factor BamB